MKLTKAELLEWVADLFEEAGRRTGAPLVRNVTVTAVKIAFSEIARRLKAGHTVALRDLGTFTVQKTKPRKRFDIATGKTVMRPGRSRIKFTPSPSLADDSITNSSGATPAVNRCSPLGVECGTVGGRGRNFTSPLRRHSSLVSQRLLLPNMASTDAASGPPPLKCGPAFPPAGCS